ncbi:2-amino-4-hydroxy-6-hydroxymethyldihydropteridine diphosphokinase [Subsaximicrobium wynnwilliamsii]|uniref:2-amino-4-hydroxy-6-hydroxymethyldihydropteridine pyrophosphokinase n=1 Tax=Subsaximicrobium wynnwilliamsii TaxID=291179 RepID=A0A5C6ZM55_9FLAO|nr:2-amino-4-hydroxy-6-hydroxymethyldihydropteridine diphosphokinase [Subsaximicrobium wynnwilliamsii]TXD85529.1 2-amino-4-hydroxy-6-hydroxymethyldihydropteridine diphosphokinase [Subsaximicrobium wynnwilliamsii]TXD90882.1 2-amino-4-hydroxy-6-hydroxymethyldihydropteridine diphosphokinase [Subsaximicrobium wynnwilliamsii]TXE05389.1 2-amino-4-hydroxy-6-hydroxymethyldihydropteridine diphosphokinase [Subsaximicrobium wynnwilliamsii]
MNSNHHVYIALGSNKGDRLKLLQDAVNLIFSEIGNVNSIARVYETPAFGFEGGDFLNTCILVETTFSAEIVLQKLQAIESRMGRERTSSETYQSRCIDLDILFFDAEIIATEDLKVPHPQLQHRKFVLQPLQDIAAKLKHPQLQQTVGDLLKTCLDESSIEPINIWLKNPAKQYDFSKYNYVAIEGNIGAGKTSLAHQLSKDFNAKLILERFADNAFLPKFYEEPLRYAFTLEMSFLADRYQQISDDLSQLDLFRDFIVSDYDIYKSLIFSKITLPEDEFILYRRLFYLMYKDIAKPDLYIYLYQNTQRLQENIKKRGRDYEQNIEDDYLDKINSGYLDFLKNQTELKVKIIDISERDFVNNRKDYLWVLEQIV